MFLWGNHGQIWAVLWADFGDDLQRVFSQKLEGLPPD